MKNLIVVLFLKTLFNSFAVKAQTAAFRLPQHYLAQMKVKMLMEYEKAPMNDTVLTVTYFYSDGKVRQRTRYNKRESLLPNDLDSNYLGLKVAFYEAYTYDTKNRITFVASTWSALMEPYITSTEYLYSTDGDTTYQIGYNHSTGENNIWKSPHLNKRDTVKIGSNKFAILNSKKDTIVFKSIYKYANKDSVVYALNSIGTSYHYEVYEDKKLVSFKIVALIEEKPTKKFNEYQMYFDESGLPYKSSYFHFSDEKPFICEIRIETF